METRQSYQETLEAELKEWDDKLALIAAEAERADPLKRVELDKRMAAIRGERTLTESWLRQAQARSSSIWRDLKRGLEIAWGELGQAVNSTNTLFH
jgi:hypothetical protein